MDSFFGFCWNPSTLFVHVADLRIFLRSDEGPSLSKLFPYCGPMGLTPGSASLRRGAKTTGSENSYTQKILSE